MSLAAACVLLLAGAWWVERQGFPFAAWALLLLAILFGADFALSLASAPTDAFVFWEVQP